MTLPPEDLTTWYQVGFGEGGDLGRYAIDHEKWMAPASVSVEDGRLYFVYDGHGDREVTVGRDLLGRFVNTWDEADEAIASFAMELGVLQLCEHGQPLGHSASAASYPIYNGCFPTGYYDDDRRTYVDLALWRLWAARALSTMTICADLTEERLPEEHHWTVTYGRPPWWRRDVEGERSKASDVLNQWLAIGQVGLSSSWWSLEGAGRTPMVRTAGRGLFGTIALQLLLTVSQAEGMAICSACGLPYARGSKAPEGRNNYCPDCGLKAARREASRRYRAKKRSEKGDK